MKKVLIVAAAAGLMTLAACEPATTGNNTADNMIQSHEANAVMYEGMADDAANAVAENAFENMADMSQNAADAVQANATATNAAAH